MYLQKIILTIFLLITGTNYVISQQDSISKYELKFADLGDFKTTNGSIINNCKIAYRTIGEINEDKSNVVLWSTWFTGTTEDIIETGLVDTLIDSDGLYIILVDALSNGVSSSPSNTINFPDISIRDMVNSQHELLVEHLGINSIYAVMGYSLGGMQALEWTVAYPNFMDKAISIAGTLKLTSRDKLFWSTMSNLLEQDSGKEMNKVSSGYRNAHNIFLMNLTTPTFLASSIHTDSLNTYLNIEYEKLMHPQDYLGNIKAILSYDIYQGSSQTEIQKKIKADLLIISASKDHILNPLNTMKLSKVSGYKSLVLNTDCGHLAPFCEPGKIRNEISRFLDK